VTVELPKFNRDGSTGNVSSERRAAEEKFSAMQSKSMEDKDVGHA